jgi:hypothetical protein
MALAHLRVGVGSEEAGVRIERAQHPLDAGVDQIAIGDFLTVARVRHFERFGEQAHPVAGRVVHREEAIAGERAGQGGGADERDREQAPRASHARDSSTRSEVCRAARGLTREAPASMIRRG